MFGVLFLIVGVIVGIIVYKTLNKPGETKIELDGENIIYIDKGESYNEDGYTFIINGRDYTEDVVVTSDLDKDTIGKYTITYKLEKDGNLVILTRVINVIGGVTDGQN